MNASPVIEPHDVKHTGDSRFFVIGFVLLLAGFLGKSIMPNFSIGALDILVLVVVVCCLGGYKFTTRYRFFLLYFVFFIVLLIGTYLNAGNYTVLGLSTLVQAIVYLKMPLLCAVFISLSPNIVVRLHSSIFPVVKVMLIASIILVFFEFLAPATIMLIFPGMVLDTYVSGTDFRRLTGIFYHPTPLSYFSALALIYMYSFKEELGSKGFVFYMGLCIILMVVSGQRGEIIFLIFSVLMAFCIVRFAPRFHSWPKLVSCVLFFLLLFWLNVNSDISFIEGGEVARLVLYLGALDIANLHFPFGSGLATFGSSASYDSLAYYDTGISDLWWYVGDHNYLTDTFWAMIVGEGGWLGLAVYILFLVSFFFFLLSSFSGVCSTAAALFIGLETFTNPIFTGAAFLSLFGLYIIVVSGVRHGR
jgi:hypothetical protein